MKRTIIALIISFNLFSVFSQTEFDALKLAQTDINGSAQYMIVTQTNLFKDPK